MEQMHEPTSSSAVESMWPPLPFQEWKETCETLHMWTQIVGKVKLQRAPFLNQYWEVAFYVTSRGLTTASIPYRNQTFEIVFDFIDHNLSIATSGDARKFLPLIPRSVADFYQEFMAALRALGIDVSINTMPVEVPNPIPLDQDQDHASYDPDYANRWWRILVQVDEILQRYRTPFVGKSSPVQFFWGSFDLNETRYSGRPATPPEGAPRFVRLAENQENVACGFWPGNATMSGATFREPAFYSYTYPEPAGYRQASIRPSTARYDDRLGEFIFPYKDARTAAPPERAIMDFFQSTYEAGATLGHWDREQLGSRAATRSEQPSAQTNTEQEAQDGSAAP